jgi:glutaredoxin
MNYQVYVTPDCHYCKEVLKLFIRHGINHQLIVLENDADIAAAKNKYDWSTVPIIVEVTAGGQKLIGGYEDTYKLLKEQKII